MTSPDAIAWREPAAPFDRPWAVHATAVAIAGRALLIRGPSKIGKSRLALSLSAASTTRRPIILIGDDRIILTPRGGDLVASPHPRIAGFIERRGLGIMSVPFRHEAMLYGVLDLVPAHAPSEETQDTIVMAGINFPHLSMVVSATPASRDELVLVPAHLVLEWFPTRDKRTTHSRESTL